MPIFTRVSGVWQEVIQPAVRVSGSWFDVTDVYVRTSGVWRRVFGGTVTVTGDTSSDTVNGTASVRISTDGNVYVASGASEVQSNSGTDWIRPVEGWNQWYEVKWDLVSGDTPNSGNMSVEGTWYTLDIDRTVGLSTGVPVLDTCVVTISIRYNGGATLDSANYTIEAIDTS